MKKASLLYFRILFLSSLALASLLIAGFRRTPPGGTIEGYIFPLEAKPLVELTYFKNNGDTGHKRFNADKNGYYKINNLEPGDHELLYRSKEFDYRSQVKVVNVKASGVTLADTVRLIRF